MMSARFANSSLDLPELPVVPRAKALKVRHSALRVSAIVRSNVLFINGLDLGLGYLCPVLRFGCCR
jgi:hypothetical protein